jgi:tyrosinase
MRIFFPWRKAQPCPWLSRVGVGISIFTLLAMWLLCTTTAIAQERVRKNIDDLKPEELATYIHAIKMLRAVSERDPQSKDGYNFFASLHNNTKDKPNPSFGPCEHGRDTFLLWHRAHLYLFEEALRKSDPPRTSNVTIPYWDWGEIPSGARYPRDFEKSESPLFFSGRETKRICRGNESPPDCLRLPFPRSLLNSTVMNLPWEGPGSFGGSHFPGNNGGEANCEQFNCGGAGNLEDPYHNAMHSSYVGGALRSTDTAANDVLFWSFHAYFDLLLAQWQAVRGKAVDTCLSCTLCGLDKPDGSGERYKVSDLLNTKDQLNYVYEYRVTPPVVAAAPGGRVAALADSSGTGFEGHPARDFVLSATQAPELIRTVSFTVPQPGFKTAKLQITGLRFGTRFGYEGNVFLYPNDVPFAPREQAFREHYLVDIISQMFVHGDHQGADHGDQHAAAGEMQKVINLTDELTGLANAHRGETWSVAVALYVDTKAQPNKELLAREVLPAGSSFSEFLHFDQMNLEIK